MMARHFLCWLGSAFLLLAPTSSLAYPLDSYEATGINRLEAYYRAVQGGAKFLAPGAEYPTSQVQLRLRNQTDFALPAPDPAFSGEVKALLAEDSSHYGIAVLDLTNPANPRYAEHNAGMSLNPGSVGKLLVALSFFQALADAHPTSIEARRRILRDTQVTADAFIRTDTHKAPFWKPGEPKVIWRPIHEGDTGNPWTFLDWMFSASSNAAAAMVQREALLLQRFGREYPVTTERAKAYFAETATSQLQADLSAALHKPVRRNGLDPEKIRQGGFFTREGKRRVPGAWSHATSRELLRYIVRMEQGKLIDPFSSLEIKRLLYLTDQRIRYASAPALRDHAVYFKSGSLYSCKAEKGFVCEKYHGNVKNYMNSVAVVETPGRAVPLHYVVVVMSNVLRKNSAVAHQTLAMRIHRLIEEFHPLP